MQRALGLSVREPLFILFGGALEQPGTLSVLFPPPDGSPGGEVLPAMEGEESLAFCEERVAAARALAALLSPEPGSMIFGAHHSSSISGRRVNTLRGTDIYDFNPEDWISLWDGEIFKKGTVQVEAGLRDWENRSEEELGYPPTQLVWCVKRK